MVNNRWDTTYKRIYIEVHTREVSFDELRRRWFLELSNCPYVSMYASLQESLICVVVRKYYLKYWIAEADTISFIKTLMVLVVLVEVREVTGEKIKDDMQMAWSTYYTPFHLHYMTFDLQRFIPVCGTFLYFSEVTHLQDNSQIFVAFPVSQIERNKIAWYNSF